MQSRLASLGPEARIGAVVALALVAGLVVWLLARGGNKSATPNSRSSVRAVSARDLAALPAAVGHPVYWAGPQAGYTYELTRTNDGRIYVRYLPAGVPLGSNQPKYLTVGTYRVRNAFAAVRGIARGFHVTPMRLSGGGIAVQDTKHPTSVYFAYPRSDYQIEVYDPSPPRALQLVLSGKIIQVGSTTAPTRAASRPTLVTAQQLSSLESSVGHPVYWVGPSPRTAYELTRPSDGRIYIRYLPSGSNAGDPKPHTTVGTYPFRNPITAVRAIAKETGGRTFAVPRGGTAAVDGRHPTSVYVAFPRSNYEIEVFDPSAARARRLVSSGLVAPVH
jgi:hypothetical protein